MRSVPGSWVRTALWCALILPAISGCSRKVTAPNSLPTPEGQQNGQILLMGWPEQASVWFVLDDPGTPNNPLDDVLSVVGHDYFADSVGVRTATLDASMSNQMQPFRLGADGNVHPLFDYLLQPTLRFIGHGADLFEFEDPTPPALPRYFERGAINGVVTTASPVSNAAGAAVFKDDMIWQVPSKLAKGDSVLKVQYVDDPNAVFDVIEIGEGTAVLGNGVSFSDERRARGIPAPLMPGLRPLAASTVVVPAGIGNPGLAITITSLHWPLYFYIRVTAFDAQSRMVNRVNLYMPSTSSGGGHNLTSYEPLGGAVEVLDPYPDLSHPISPPTVLTRDQAFAILQQYGGNPRPNQVTFLGASSSAMSPGSVGGPVPDAIAQIQAGPLCSASAMRKNIATVLTALARAGSGSLQAAPVRSRTVTPGRAGR